jgi:DNA topoisomerase-1
MLRQIAPVKPVSPKTSRSAASRQHAPATPVTHVDPVKSAKEAGLRYVHDDSPGIRRRRAGRGYIYMDDAGRRIGDPQTLIRIRQLVIPPAWRNVWICPLANGHIQAIGRDARGRKQYRYNERWREVRDQTKYNRMIAFAQALPVIRRRVDEDLKRAGLPREKLLATVTRLLETTFIRVGNEEYAHQNHSFGLTTMRDTHVDVDGALIHFEFRGKSGVEHAIDLRDQRLARIIEQCQELPGHELFKYVDHEGQRHQINSDDVNQYLRQISGQDFTAKDFRTWAGTVLAALALQTYQEFDSKAQARRNIVAAIESVARKLGNTKAVCRKCYIHPAIIESYLDGDLIEALKQRAERKLCESMNDLRPAEAAVVALLQQRLCGEARKRAGDKAPAADAKQ